MYIDGTCKLSESEFGHNGNKKGIADTNLKAMTIWPLLETGLAFSR